jgi:hypothetical protein
MRGLRGAGAGSRKLLNFGHEKLDSMRGAQGAWFGEPICATSFINYNLYKFSVACSGSGQLQR